MPAYDCSMCNASGVVKDGRTERTCPNCNGTGHIPRAFITVDECAAALGFEAGDSQRAGRMRVYRLINAGRIRAVRLGRSVRIPASEIERLAGAA